MKSEWVVCGFAGLAAGVILGLAFAPQSGEETQALVKQKTREGLDQLAAGGKKVATQVQDIVGKGKDLAARGKEQVTDAVEAGKQAYNNAAVRA